MLVSLTGKELVLLLDAVDHSRGNSVTFEADELSQLSELHEKLGDALRPAGSRSVSAPR